MSAPVKVTHRTLRGMYAALELLANRRLPSLDADLKVARLLTLLGPVAEPARAARDKVALRVMEETIGGLEPEKVPQPIVALSNTRTKVAIDEFDAEIIEIELPPYRITKEDLPKDKAGDDGWKNGEAAAAIAADLGPLFRFDEADERRLRGE